MLGGNKQLVLLNLSYEQMGDSVIDYKCANIVCKLRWYHAEASFSITFFLEVIMQELILFIMCYVVVLAFYELYFVRRAKKYKKGKMSKKKKDKYKEPGEIVLLKSKFKVNTDKVNYDQLLQIVALVSSFDISLVVSVMSLIPIFVLKLVVGFILIFVTIYVSYYLVYLFYKKKGLIKNG